MKFQYPGLTEAEALQSRNQNGSNAVTTQEVESFSDKLLANLKDPIIIILIAALGITVFLSVIGFAPWYEGVGIAIAVAIATLVATWSEYSNENEFQKLLEEASLVKVKAFRDNNLQEISINDLVSGDHVVLQPGDTVPADGYLLAGKLEVNAAALTGESEPIKKVQVEDPSKINEEQNELPRAALVDDGEVDAFEYSGGSFGYLGSGNNSAGQGWGVDFDPIVPVNLGSQFTLRPRITI